MGCCTSRDDPNAYIESHSPLYWCLFWHYRDIKRFKILLERGADPNLLGSVYPYRECHDFLLRYVWIRRKCKIAH